MAHPLVPGDKRHHHAVEPDWPAWMQERRARFAQEQRRADDDALCRAIEVLRKRGKDDLASQVAAVRFEEPTR